MCVSLDYGKGSYNECVRCGNDATDGRYWAVGERICSICLSLPKKVFERSDPDSARKESLIRKKALSGKSS